MRRKASGRKRELGQGWDGCCWKALKLQVQGRELETVSSRKGKEEGTMSLRYDLA